MGPCGTGQEKGKGGRVYKVTAGMPPELQSQVRRVTTGTEDTYRRKVWRGKINLTADTRHPPGDHQRGGLLRLWEGSGGWLASQSQRTKGQGLWLDRLEGIKFSQANVLACGVANGPISQ
eukprot:EG_transcript_28467